LRDAVRVAHEVVESEAAALKNVTDTRDAFVATMTDVSRVNAKRAELVDKLHEISGRVADARGAEKALADAKAQIKAKSAETDPFTEQVARLEGEIKVLTGERDKAVAAQDAASQAVKAHELAAKVYSPAGVRALMLDEVTPFLNDQTAKYLGTLSDGNISATWTTLVKDSKGELREKFAIEVVNAKGADTFKGVSGGEKRKVRIACALALQDLVARRASKPIELFIGDEIDDALDKAGLERLNEILKEKAKERGSVFVISHNDLKDWVPTTLVVTRRDGKSTVEEMA
jgi:DNA repair exonuclease SbcCD ATPase subunit